MKSILQIRSNLQIWKQCYYEPYKCENHLQSHKVTYGLNEYATNLAVIYLSFCGHLWASSYQVINGSDWQGCLVVITVTSVNNIRLHYIYLYIYYPKERAQWFVVLWGSTYTFSVDGDLQSMKKSILIIWQCTRSSSCIHECFLNYKIAILTPHFHPSTEPTSTGDLAGVPKALCSFGTGDLLGN